MNPEPVPTTDPKRRYPRSARAPLLRRGLVKPAERHREKGNPHGVPGDAHIYLLRGPSGRRVVPEDFHSDRFDRAYYFVSAREGAAEPEDKGLRP